MKNMHFSWYHGDISRNAAEALLLSNGKEGTYLLRSSTKHQGYSVSVRLVFMYLFLLIDLFVALDKLLCGNMWYL